MTVTNKRIAEELSRCGGTAYPATVRLPEGGELVCPGMTLHDWFAGQALAAMEIQILVADPAAEKMSESAYRIADAMLAERSKSGGEHA